MPARRLTALVLAGLVLAAGAPARAEDPRSARSIVAEHCIQCHRVPGFAHEGRSEVAIVAPDFQAIADDRKTYTPERLASFLINPHYPMRRIILSEADIRNIIAFIESLRAAPPVQ